MPALLLNRQCRVEVLEPDSIVVVCEPRAGVSAGSCARIGPDPGTPLGLWRRTYLRAAPELFDGRPVNVFVDLPAGVYEAHSTLRSRRAQVIYFRVTDGAIEILGGQGDEDLVVAILNGLTLAELHDARAAAAKDDGLPPLDGSFRQVAWAVRVRDDLIRAAEAAGDLDLAARLRHVRDATWFIANRDRTLNELRERLGTQV